MHPSAGARLNLLAVRDLIEKPALTIAGDDSLLKVMELMSKRQVSKGVVVENGFYLGVADLYTLTGEFLQGRREQTAKQLANPNYPVLNAEQILTDISGMTEEFYPVVDEHKFFRGVVLRNKLEEKQRERVEVEFQRTLKTFERLNQELDTIFNSSYDGLMITDENGRGIKVNKAHTRLTGTEEEHFVGKSIEELFNKGIFLHQSITIRALKEGRRVTGVQKFNSGKEVLVTGNPVFDKEGKVFRVITNVHDITELNRLKEKLEEAEALNTKYQLELQRLKGQIDEENIVTHSQSVQKIYELASHVANSDATILVLGESGVGKEGLVRMIHRKSYRAKLGQFVHINCGAIPENLIESELFGYEPGAFTGAEKNGKKGLFEVANKGTLFLDEIGELPLSLQVKLLRVLQEQEVYRLGGTSPIKLDVRIVAASNKNLLEKVEEGLFREDLFYRLNVVPIELPPLRERPEDVLPLAMHYVKKFNQKYKVNKIFSANTLKILQNYDWPGNIRELVNVVERLIVTSQEELIDIDQLSSHPAVSHKFNPVIVAGIIPLREAREILEKRLIAMALNRYRTVREAAKALGVSHSVVVERISLYKIKRNE